MMKIYSVLVVIGLLLSSVAVFADENPNVGVNVPAVGRNVKLPDTVEVFSIYYPGVGANLVWRDIRRFGKEKLIEILQSPSTRVTAKIFENGVYRPLGRKEFLKILKAEGYETGIVKPKLRKGTFKETRAKARESMDIGKCTSIFVAGPNENMPRRLFERLQEKEKIKILSHPKTKSYLKRCI